MVYTVNNNRFIEDTNQTGIHMRGNIKCIHREHSVNNCSAIETMIGNTRKKCVFFQMFYLYSGVCESREIGFIYLFGLK